MRVGFMGRSGVLYDSILGIVDEGRHEVSLIWTSPEEEYDGADVDSFRVLSERIGCPFVVSSRVEDDCEIPPGIDVICSVNFVNLIPRRFLDRIPHGVLNAHLGDLPRFRGNACPNWAILNGEEQVGLVVHEMSEDLDAGPIYWSDSMGLTDQTYVGDVYDWMNSRVPVGFREALLGVESGEQPLPQRDVRPLRTFPRREEDSRILWNRGSVEVCRLVRASSRPFPGAFCYLNGDDETTVRVLAAESVELDYDILAVDGQVLSRDGDSFVVSSGNQAVRVTECAVNGRPHADSVDFVTSSLRNRLTSWPGRLL